MQATVSQLAVLVGGRVVGDGDVMVSGAKPLGEAGPGDITLVDGVEKNGSLSLSRASAAVAPRSFGSSRLPVIEVDEAHLAFSAIVAHFHAAPRPGRRRCRADARRGRTSRS